VAANKSGKIKTATTMVWIILLFLSNYPFEVINIPVTEYLGYFVVLITVYS
jgi:CDP-diacylglycerol--glycerol-3-phosphate 3-phosphatidyltransferase